MNKATGYFFGKSDEWFFKDHPDRLAHIRQAFQGECEYEFRSLGDHDFFRRRMLFWRVPKDHPNYKPGKEQIIKIPFLAFIDETIEDRDDVLLPIIDTVMREAAYKYAREGQQD